MKVYPLDSYSIAGMTERLLAGNSCYIPCQSDVTMLDGKVLSNIHTWGHPEAYEIVTHEGKKYGVPKHGKIEYA